MSGPDPANSGVDPEWLSRLAGGLAHELKNPLSTLGMHLALLREQWEQEDSSLAHRSARSLNTIEKEVSRLNDILEDFLRFARTGELELKWTSLNDLVEQVVAFLRPEAEARGIEIESFLDANLPLLKLDPARIKQVVLNLLINARQAMTERSRGRITVITRPDSAGEYGEILEIVDDGPGMDPETLERAFEVYYSTKKAGSGLGLALVRRVIEAHDGQVEIQSSLGFGTRVMLRLPHGDGDPPPANDEAQA
ncbi:MAG: ATP-binding protein [Planctomycetes bacterium]|nr:ATP-binding protein [Planctomycetota bacterium]